MWNILIVLIIAAVVWMFGSSSWKLNPEDSTSLSTIRTIKATDTAAQRSVVESLTESTVNEINNARQIEQQQQDAINNQ